MTHDLHELFKYIYPNNIDAAIQLLADASMNPNIIWSGIRSTSPLKMAIANGREKIALAIINHPLCNIDFDTSPNCIERAIHIAIQKGNVVLVQALLEKGADIHQNCFVNIHGCFFSKSPLYLAAEYGHLEIARMLLENGTYVDGMGGQIGQSAFMIAAENGHVQMATLLLAHGANRNYRTEQDGYTALMLAARKGNAEMVFFLLDAGCDFDLTTHDKKSLLNVLEDSICYAEQWPACNEPTAEALRYLKWSIIKGSRGRNVKSVRSDKVSINVAN